MSIYNNLQRVVAEMKADPKLQVQTKLGENVGLTLRLMTDQPIADQPWLTEVVVSRMKEAESIWRKRDPNLVPSGSFGFAEAWIVNEDTLAGAIQLGEHDDFEMPWEFIAAVLTHKQYARQSERTDAVFDAVAEHAEAPLFERVQERLVGFQMADVPISGGGSGGGFVFGGFGTSIPIHALGQKHTIWPKAIKFYCEHTPDPAGSLELLKRLREIMTTTGVDPQRKDRPLEALDSAIQKLSDELSAETP